MPEMMTWQSYIRYHSRFFVRVWHEIKNASSGNHHLFTIVIVRPTKIIKGADKN